MCGIDGGTGCIEFCGYLWCLVVVLWLIEKEGEHVQWLIGSFYQQYTCANVCSQWRKGKHEMKNVRAVFVSRRAWAVRVYSGGFFVVYLFDYLEGGGGRLEPILMSVWISLEYVPSSSCCPLSKSGKRRPGAAIVLFIRQHPRVADTFVSRGRWVGAGGGLVSSLVAKSSTTSKDDSGYMVIRGMWLCVVVDRKGRWKLRVA